MLIYSISLQTHTYQTHTTFLRKIIINIGWSAICISTYIELIYMLEHGVQGHDGAEVHGVHVLVRASRNGLNDELVCSLCWVERVPKCI